MKVDDQVLVHIEKFRQHLVCELRGKDLQVTRRSQRLPHLKVPPILENKTGRRNEILCGKTALDQLVVLEGKRGLLLRIKCFIHDLKPLHTVQRICLYAQYLEVIQNIGFNPFELRSGIHDVVSFNGKGDVFCPDQSVISLGKLVPEHLSIFHADIVKRIPLRFNPDYILILHEIRLVFYE